LTFELACQLVAPHGRYAAATRSTAAGNTACLPAWRTARTPVASMHLNATVPCGARSRYRYFLSARPWMASNTDPARGV
jgi:hypothetical protein